MFAGTSTGAIVAAGISHGKKPADIVDLYREHGSKIFGTPHRSIWPADYKQLFHSKFRSNHLCEVMHDQFKTATLGDLKKPTLLPATDIGLGGVHVFKSAYSKRFTRDPNVLIADAVIASCSAPTFFDPIKVDTYLLADGGVWANNPSLAAVLDAQKRLSIDQDSIRILSIGTGHSKSFYGTKIRKHWGLATSWGRQKFIELIMSLQAQSTHNYLKILLQPNQLLRLNFDSDVSLPLDDASSLDDMISRADKEFSVNGESIKSFLRE